MKLLVSYFAWLKNNHPRSQGCIDLHNMSFGRFVPLVFNICFAWRFDLRIWQLGGNPSKSRFWFQNFPPSFRQERWAHPFGPPWPKCWSQGSFYHSPCCCRRNVWTCCTGKRDRIGSVSKVMSFCTCGPVFWVSFSSLLLCHPYSVGKRCLFGCWAWWRDVGLVGWNVAIFGNLLEYAEMMSLD